MIFHQYNLEKIFSYDLSISLTNTKGLGKLNEYFSNNENIKKLY